jgi:hypothetical protein
MPGVREGHKFAVKPVNMPVKHLDGNGIHEHHQHSQEAHRGQHGDV